MNDDGGLRFMVARRDLTRTRVTPDPHGSAALPLVPGQVRLRIEHFALTSNNITYAAFGKAMKYWQFFPTDDAAWGCIPVWGFAVVSESTVKEVQVGRRVYGYLPMASYLVVSPARLNAHGFVDASAHRAELPGVYNQLSYCDHDPSYRANLEGQQAILRPLFTTSFLIDDFFADQGFFGAQQLLLSSASSKTAYGTSFCLARRRGGAVPLRTIGFTSSAQDEFTRSLGCYDEVRLYGDLEHMTRDVATAYIDFSGDAAFRRRVHEHFGQQLRYSCSVGGTHWDELGSGAGLPGPRPTLFFAPAQAKKRAAPPPDGWGAESLQQRLDDAWRLFLGPVCDAATPWLSIVHAEGAEATEAAYRAVLLGQVPAQQGIMLRL